MPEPQHPRRDADAAPAAAAADALLSFDLEQIGGLLDDETTFRSPVAEYVGRRRILELLTAVGQVLAAPRTTSTLHSEHQAVRMFTATVAGRPADGVLHVTADGGRVRSITLMLRPLGTLLAAVEEMRTLLGLPPAPA